MSDIGLDNATQKATRPASRWRNRWFPLRNYTTQSGLVCRRHQEYWGVVEWPCRDTAETGAHQWINEWPNYAEHLGAFPVEGS